MSDGSPKTFKKVVVVFIYLLIALWGVRRALLQEMRPIDLIICVTISFLMVQFCVIDSRIRGKPVLHSFRWMIFFTWPISVPIYLLWSRGVKGIGPTVLYVLSIILTQVLAFHVTGYLIYGEGWF